MSGIGQAIENLARAAPEYFEELLPVLQELGRTVVLPIGVGVICLAALLRILEILLRIIFPPNATALRKEALGCLKKGDGAQTWSQAKTLLQKSIKRDPTYLPSYLSLVALQLYQEEDHEGALETIREAKAKNPAACKNNKDMRNLELDAVAMSSNLGHMVLAGSFASPHLGGVYKPAKTPKSPAY